MKLGDSSFMRALWPASFRWVKPAASLKRWHRGGGSVAVVCFRWVKPAASLKHQFQPLVGQIRTTVSAG